MGKRILFLDDLYNYFKFNYKEDFKFTAKDEDLVVQIPGKITYSKKGSDDTEGLFFCDVRTCHIDKNRNGSYISEDAMKKAMPSLKNRPFLASIHKLDDGNYDFHSHDIDIATDEDGEEYREYVEKQVGTFTEDDPYLEYDEEKDKTYVVARVAIPEEYTMAADIIRRKGGSRVSCELAIREFSYNSKEKYLELEDFYFSGCTALGSEKDGTEILEGMEGSRITSMESFSTDNFKKELDELKQAISDLNIKYQGKEVAEVDKETKDMFEEEVTETTEFEEVASEDIATDEEVTVTEEEFEEAAEENPEVVEEEMSEEDSEEEHEEEHEEDDVEIENHSIELSYTLGKITRNFAVSLSDIIYSLTTLVNETYSDDMSYYVVDVFADDKYVIMQNVWTGEAYKQTYKVKKDSYTLTGDRVPVKAVFLTADEEKALDDMRSNYSIISDKLDSYQKAEELSAKKSILGNEMYSAYIDSDEFKQLNEKIDEYTIDEFSTACELAFAKCVHKLGFAMNKETSGHNHTFKLSVPVSREEKRDVYGGIFKKANKYK